MAGMLAVILTLAAGTRLHAQSSLETAVDRPSRILLEKGYTTFTVNVINTSSKNITLQVIRTLNERPDDTWEISVCSPTVCYEAEVDTLDPYIVAPGQNGAVQVHMLAGTDGAARVILQFDPQDGTQPLTVELRGEVGMPPEPSILATVDSTESITAGGRSVAFGFAIFNATDDSLVVTLKRRESFFPSNDWSTRLCLFGYCIDPAIDSIRVPLETHRAALFAVEITTGTGPGTTGEVEVEVIPADGSESTYHRFEATVEQTGSVRYNNDAPGTEDRFFPNPTTGSGTVLLPSTFAGEELVVILADGMGREIRRERITAQEPGTNSAPGLLRIDPDGLPSGTYYYRITGREEVVSGSFIVIR